MKKYIHHFVTAILCLVYVNSQAEQISMAFGEKIPPFCFPETNSGIELEVIGEALAHKGHTLAPQYFPLGRVPYSFKTKVTDAAMTDMGQDLSRHGGHYGDPAVIYENVLITLKHRELKIETPSDLADLSVMSFQGALNRYPEWLAQPNKEGKFRAHSNQELQVKNLYRGRFDVVLSDRNIFKYFMLKRKKDTGNPIIEIQEHVFTKLNPLNYRPIFRSKKIRDDFNEGLKFLKESGRFQKIYDNYLKE